jgi:hypothetical protein
MQRGLIVAVLAAFGALTAAALWQHGYLGIFLVPLQTLAGAQVLADLVIALGLVLAWLVQDARAQGRNPWPWVAATLALGSFGPLMYLLVRRPASR